MSPSSLLPYDIGLVTSISVTKPASRKAAGTDRPGHQQHKRTRELRWLLRMTSLEPKLKIMASKKAEERHRSTRKQDKTFQERQTDVVMVTADRHRSETLWRAAILTHQHHQRRAVKPQSQSKTEARESKPKVMKLRMGEGLAERVSEQTKTEAVRGTIVRHPQQVLWGEKLPTWRQWLARQINPHLHRHMPLPTVGRSGKRSPDSSRTQAQSGRHRSVNFRTIEQSE